MIEAPDWMIIGAVRYAVGRFIGQVDKTCEWLVVHWRELPESVRDVIQQDLESDFRRDDFWRALDAGRALPLGSDIDRRAWESVRALWLEAGRGDT